MWREKITRWRVLSAPVSVAAQRGSEVYPINPSALVEKGVGAAKAVPVDLKKRYLGVLDVVYSANMGRKPPVPKFKTNDEETS